MSVGIVECHKVAQQIEWITAKRIADARRKGSAEEEYDAHAATELGNWLYRLFGPTTSDQTRTGP